MKLLFTIKQSNEKETEPGAFITKLVRTFEVQTEFGIKKGKQTLYVKGTIKMEKDTEIVVDMDKFRIEEHPASIPIEETGEVKEMMLKWLHLKVA